MSATPYCRRRGCRSRMVEVLDKRTGRVDFLCRQCERTKARLCRDCPNGTSNSRAIRCAACAKIERRKKARDWKRNARRDDEKRKRINAVRRRNYHSNAASRARILASIAEYSKSHPRVRDDAFRLVEKIRVRGYRANPVKNQRINKRRRLRAKRKRLQKQRPQIEAAA